MSLKYDKDYYKSWQSRYYANSIKTINQLKRFKGYYKRWFNIMKESSSNRFRNELYQITIDKFNDDLLKHKKGEKISTLAKWLPRENSSLDRELNFVENITNKMFPAVPKNKAKQLYRKNIVELSKKLNVIESLMSQKKLSEINFSKIPDIAFKRNSNNFIKHPELMNKFIEEYMSRLNRKHSGYFIDELVEYSKRTPFERGLIRNAFNLRKNKYFNKLNNQKYTLNNCVPVLDTSNRNLKTKKFKKQLLISLYFASESNKIIINSDKELKCLDFDWKIDIDKRIHEVYKHLEECNCIDTDFILEQIKNKHRLVVFYDDKLNIKLNKNDMNKRVFILDAPKNYINNNNNNNYSNYISMKLIIIFIVLLYYFCKSL